MRAISSVFICLCFVGCLASALAVISCRGKPRGSKDSPCQCKMAERKGCLPNKLLDVVYADGTTKEDYDPWGRYIGSNEDVPDECRPD